MPEREVALPSASQLEYAAHILVAKLQDFCGDKRNRFKCVAAEFHKRINVSVKSPTGVRAVKYGLCMTIKLS